MVTAAEVGHSPVEGGQPPLDDLGVVTGELGRREGGEDQLAPEAQEVKGTTPFRRVEGPEPRPTLRCKEVLLGLLGSFGIVASCRGLGHGLVSESARSAQVERPEAIADIRIGVGLQPVGEFHDVAVRVIDDAPLNVSHGSPCDVRRPVDRR